MHIFQKLLGSLSGRYKFLFLAFSLSICALVYYPGLSGNFVHDDYPNIVQNSKLHIDSLDYQSLSSASYSVKSGPLMRPISMLSFAVNYYAFGLDPQSYKVINVIIHIIVSLLLFLLSSLLLDCYRKIYNQKLTNNYCFYIALATSIAWLVSPINLTGVLYVVQRMTSLSALFSVAGLCLYVLARRSMIFDKSNNYYYFFLSGISFLVAILSKENGILNLLYLLCIELCFFRFISNTNISPKFFRALFLITTLTPITFAVFWIIYNPAYLEAGYSHREFSLADRLLTESRILVNYLKWIVVPNISELGLFHDDISISRTLFSPLTTLFSLSFITFLFLLAIIKIRSMAFLSFGILFYFSSHALESTVIPLELAYEHRNYLASYGIILGIITSIFFFISKSSSIKITIGIVCIWLSAISITTTLRAHHWGNEIRHAHYEVTHHPKSGRAIYNLGRIYANLSIQTLPDEREYALSLFEQFINLSPSNIIGESSAIVFSSAIDKEIKPEWLEGMLTKLETQPITHNTSESLQQINSCLNKSCKLTVNQVFKLYITALNNQIPTSKRSRSDLLSLYAVFASNYLGDKSIAYNAMVDAVDIKPDVLQYRVNLITLLIDMNNFDEAMRHIEYIDENDTFKSFTIKTTTLKEKLKQQLNHNLQGQ